MRIAICEDNAKDAALLKRLVEDALRDGQYEGEVDPYDSAEALLAAYGERRYAIVFLDIYLDGVDGMEAARRIRAQNEECAIIFVTVSESHAVEAYAVRAAHYLPKPVTRQKVDAALERCRIQLESMARYIEVISNRVTVRVALRDVLYIDAYSKTCVIHTDTGTIRTYVAFDAMQAMVSGAPFVRCHRSYIVNMRRIKRLSEKEILMQNDVTIPIGGLYKDSFRKTYNEYAVAAARSSAAY